MFQAVYGHDAYTTIETGKNMYLIVKQCVDLTIALIAVLVFTPLFLLVIIILRFTGEGEIFYRQERIGKNNKPIYLIKFVTMKRNSEHMGSITRKGDPRILPFGKLLRATKINELPQLLNVFTGDLALVGPRPLVLDGFEMYPKHVQELIYKNNQPGLTGLGSLFFRNEEEMLERLGEHTEKSYREDIMPVKGELELFYRKNKSCWIDFKIIIFTALAVAFPRNTWHLKGFKRLPKRVIEPYEKLYDAVSIGSTVPFENSEEN